MSVVLCLPAHLCVSTAASRGQAPYRNASKAFHRRGVTHPSRVTRGHQPRAARRRSSQLAACSAAQRLAAPPSDSAESVKEVRGPELRHQRVPSAVQQGRTPSYSNHFHNHRPTSTGRTPSPVLHHPPQQPPQDHSIENTDGELGRGGQDLAAAPPHAARLLRGLLWGQQYRHSNPQCEGGMPGSFELREDMGEDRLRAVEEWLRAEGYEYRFRCKRWRTWTCPDRPGEGLRPDGIEEDGKPNEYPSGASINVSMWDMMEKEFPELANEHWLQGSSSSGASPGKEKRSAGDRKWREYQESLAAEAAQGARGGTPAHSPQQANGGHHPGHTTLGDFLEVAKQAKAKPRPLLLRKSGPSSDVESAHRGRTPADQASSSCSVAPHQRDVARACERTCGVPCNLRVARQRATQQNAAMEGAVGIAHEEATESGRAMDYHASTVAAIAAALTAAAAHEAVAARIRGEVAATAEETRLTQEAIACKEAEVKALEEALAQERAKKEAEESAHAEATAKAQADAARKDVIEAARRKVADERAKTEAELAALEAEKARLQQAREAEAARAREEAEGRAAAATAAAMEEAEAKLRRETRPGGSQVETLRKLFEGDASSKMTLDEVDTCSSGIGGPTAYQRRKGKWKTPERPRRPAGGHPHDSDPFFTASDGDERGRRHRQGVAGDGGGDVPMEPEDEDEDPPPPYRSSESSETETPRWGDMDEDDDMDFDYTKKPSSSDPPRRPGGGQPGPPGGGPSGPPGGRPPSGPPGGGPRGGG